MTVDEVKKELSHMEPSVLKDLTSFILKLRRSLDPERKKRLSSLIDSPEEQWVSLEEVEKRLKGQ